MLDNSELSDRILPQTLEELAELDWKAFEALATQTIRKYYAQFSIEILSTPLSHDDARDGEGVLEIGKDLPELTMIYTIRVEVKKRSVNVTLDDVGKNLVVASNRSVHKLVLVTNRDFAPQVEREIERFAARHAMSYGLVNGEKLIDLARRVSATADSAADLVTTNPTLQIDLSYSRQPHPIDVRQVDDLVAPPDEPVFLNATICRTDRGSSVSFTVELFSDDEAVKVVQYSAPRAISLAGGEHARVVFTIFRKAGAGEPTLQLRVFADGQEIRTTPTWLGRCRPASTLLSRWIPESRWQHVQRWATGVRDWIKSGGIFSFALIAYPGVGKSAMLNRLRAVWLESGVRELFLEGGRRTTDADIASLLFEAAFPVDPALLRNEMMMSVEQWLLDCRIDAPRAAKMAAAMCNNGFRPGDWHTEQLAELCASLIRRLGGDRRFAFVVEDLHFYAPSAIELLSKIHMAVRTCGDANIAFICTTRQLPAIGDAAARTGWTQQLRDFLERTSIDRVMLDAFDEEESVEILQRTIPTLEPHLARLVVDQVGRTPLALREAVAFFRTENIVWVDPILRSLTVNRDRLTTIIKSDTLKTVTRSRISALKAQHPLWLSDLIDGAACVGRFFRFEDVLPHGWTGDKDQQDAIALCEELDVIRVYEEGLWSFDHDLIRNAVVEALPATQQQRVAQALAERAAFRERPLLRGSLLYQAGRFREAADELQAAGGEAMSRHRFGDAMRALSVAVACVDPATASRAGALEGLDIAIAHAVAPKRKGPPTEATRRRVLELMTLLLRCTGAAVYASRAAAAYLTEATMLARHLGDERRLAELLKIKGIRAFEREELAESIAAHRDADELLERIGAPAATRAENLLRLAITQRQQNDLKNALATIRRAHRIAGSTDRGLLSRLTLNAGAVYLNDNLPRAARYWRAALAMAEKERNIDRLIHAMVDVGYIELLLGHEDKAAELLSRGYALSLANELDNSAMRSASNLACLHLVRGELPRALDLLAYAEEVGIRLEIGRRLWRIRANLATTYEALGDLQRAYAVDSYVVDSIGRGDRILHEGRRHSIPLLNIALRARESDLHGELLKTLDADVLNEVLRMLAVLLAGETSGNYHGLAAAFKKIGDRRRFIVTE